MKGKKRRPFNSRARSRKGKKTKIKQDYKQFVSRCVEKKGGNIKYGTGGPTRGEGGVAGQEGGA